MFVNLFIFLTILPFSFSELPTSMPTIEPITMSPSDIPTGAPTIEPNIVSPTDIPTRAPTSFPTVQIGSDMIVFGLELGIEGVSADDMNSDFAAQQAIEEATCNSMGNGVTSNMCEFINAVDSTTRRLSGRKLTTSCDVNIMANVPISQVSGGNNDAQDSYDVLSNSINTAASTGALTQAIQTAAAEDGASILISASSNSVTEEPYTEYNSTSTPSASPTQSSPPSSNDNNLTDEEIAGIVIGSGFGVILLYMVISRFVFSDKDKSMQSISPPFRKPIEYDAAGLL